MLTEEKRAKMIAALKSIQNEDDTEINHAMADCILTDALILLGYTDIVIEYDKVPKWFA